jgi:hypothetical protein
VYFGKLHYLSETIHRVTIFDWDCKSPGESPAFFGESMKAALSFKAIHRVTNFNGDFFLKYDPFLHPVIAG